MKPLKTKHLLIIASALAIYFISVAIIPKIIAENNAEDFFREKVINLDIKTIHEDPIIISEKNDPKKIQALDSILYIETKKSYKKIDSYARLPYTPYYAYHTYRALNLHKLRERL